MFRKFLLAKSGINFYRVRYTETLPKKDFFLICDVVMIKQNIFMYLRLRLDVKTYVNYSNNQKHNFD